jgi:radical SAM protein with 4Fe4S-binding SPASM domain
MPLILNFLLCYRKGVIDLNWSIGIGTTNRCNLNCPHCYSREKLSSDLNYQQVKNILDSINIHSINFGTGENWLNKDFLKILDLVKERGIKIGLTSNGYTVLKLPQTYLDYFNDIDISLEFPCKENQSQFRGVGSWELAINAIERCVTYNIETSIACCMMNINVDDIPGFRTLISEFGINLRLNIYKPVNTRKYCLSYKSFWEGIKNIFSSMKLIACSEPIINAVLGIEGTNLNCGCGKTSLRISPNGDVLPCVYWNKSDTNIYELNKIDGEYYKYMHITPNECLDCKYVSICGGGCESRRLYNNLQKPDEYCPFIRGDKIDITYQKVDKKDLVHSSYLCTIIMCN